jgi:DNA-binding response OmpR family regulator
MRSDTVLIVEDDATLLRGLEDNFRSRGFQVLTATDGDGGYDAAVTSKPDLVILDIMLPKSNGFEVCRAIRQRDLEMPIIMLTAKGQEDDIVRGLEMGADDYITKPFSIRELLARSNAFLRRRHHEQSDQFRFGDCELDLDSHRFLRQGNDVELTSKEFRMLEYFVTKPGRALTRNDIMDTVWGDRVIVTARSVDRCITTLRGKIEPDPSHPTFIKTIRNVGYRFDCEPTAT